MAQPLVLIICQSKISFEDPVIENFTRVFRKRSTKFGFLDLFGKKDAGPQDYFFGQIGRDDLVHVEYIDSKTAMDARAEVASLMHEWQAPIVVYLGIGEHASIAADPRARTVLISKLRWIEKAAQGGLRDLCAEWLIDKRFTSRIRLSAGIDTQGCLTVDAVGRANPRFLDEAFGALADFRCFDPILAGVARGIADHHGHLQKYQQSPLPPRRFLPFLFNVPPGTGDADRATVRGNKLVADFSQLIVDHPGKAFLLDS